MADPFIIAEAAQGYEGDAATARRLIEAASTAGADAVKFQIIFADDVCVPEYEHYELFRDLEMPVKAWRDLRGLARDLGIEFHGDLSGAKSLELGLSLDLDGAKIPSTCFFETGLIDAVLQNFNKVLIGAGGIELEELQGFITGRGLTGRPGLTVLHGFQAEPTTMDRNNLARIPALRDALGVDIGFMDHTEGTGPDTVAVSAMALAMGVRVFEKHITLERALKLEDHISALTPGEFSQYVADINRLAQAVGDGNTALNDEERSYRGRALKRVVAVRRLRAGARLENADLIYLRPARIAGLIDARLAVGRALTRDIDAGEPIEQGDLA